MKKLKKGLLGSILLFFIIIPPAFAQNTHSEVVKYTKSSLQIITVIATASTAFFLIRAGYIYMTSAGDPKALNLAKKTIRNALIGLTLILAANVVTSVFRHSLNGKISSASQDNFEVVSIETTKPSDGLTQVLIDAVSGFIQNIVESSTAPIVDGILGYLTTTPTLLDNEVIRNFWLISVGICDTLFVLVVALMGLQIMSATTFGFEEVEIKHLLPRLGIAFLGANVSLFLADYVIITCNALVRTVLESTGGLNHALIENAINPTTFITGATPLIILIFLVIFLIISIVLLLFYISRLILISLGVVLSPFTFLLWSFPKTAAFALIGVKSYIATVFTVFVHVVVIQLAGSFLTLPEHSENSLVSIAVAIGLFMTLLKIPPMMTQMIYHTSKTGTFKKLGSQIINIIGAEKSSGLTRKASQNRSAEVKKR